jgi:hypothetical protein
LEKFEFSQPLGTILPFDGLKLLIIIRHPFEAVDAFVEMDMTVDKGQSWTRCWGQTGEETRVKYVTK